MRYGLTLASVLCALGCSSNGVLSGGSEDDQAAAAMLGLTALGTTTTTGGLVTTNELSPSTPSLWLADRRNIEIAIARGHGGWIDDLADELALPEGLVPHLGAALRRQHGTLSTALREPLHTARWERLLGAALCCDAWVRPFASRRFGCHPEEALECSP